MHELLADYDASIDAVVEAEDVQDVKAESMINIDTDVQDVKAESMINIDTDVEDAKEKVVRLY